jgi:hypothetical protein
MQPKPARQISYVYLTLIPYLAAVPAFAIGHINHNIYLPVWIINSVLMLVAMWTLGLHVFKTTDIEKKHHAIISILLILPWLFISIFFGMGPPPDVPAVWIERSTEQQTRYTILAVSGILIALGFGGLRETLKKHGEGFYSKFGFVAITIAVPLYLMYISLLHSFDFEAFKISTTTGKLPEWYSAIEKQYSLIAIMEAALLYLATALFAASLHFSGWFTKNACHVYIIISIIALLSVVFYPLYASTVAFLGIFPLLIPAIPFIMPYLMGVNLLKRAGDEHFIADTSRQ